MLRWQVGVRKRGENKKQNEPRKLNPRAVMFCGRGHERQGDDPEGAGEFDGGANYQRLRAVLRGGADDGAGVVNGQRGPESELRLRKMERVSNGRKNQQRNRIQNKNRAKGDRHFLLIGLNNRADRGDSAAAANGRARGNQERRVAADLQQFAERRSHQKREGDSESGVNKSAAARFQNFVQIHPEADGYDGNLQKNTRGGAAGLPVRMREEQAKQNSREECHRRRKNSGE